MDISALISRTGIGLEKRAFDAFGAAVEDFRRGPAAQRGTVISSSKPDITQEKTNVSYSSASYAAVLAGGTNWRPKLKFLFKVEFFFTQEAKELLSTITGATMNELDNNEFTFMIKTVDRPKVDFEYEDDVNMYNFRTKVLKKIRHRELTITFMDDTGNRVIKFFDNMMLLHSPITRRAKNRIDQYGKPEPYTLNEPGSGMVFSSGPQVAESGDLSHRGVINSPVGTAIESIRVKQMFTDLSAVPGENLKQVCFDFINPRIVSFDLDDLSHETSEVNLLTMQFDYDWMEIMDNTITEQSQNTPVFAGVAPGINETPFDISPSKNSSQTSPGGNNTFSRLNKNAGEPLNTVIINRSQDVSPGGGASILNGIFKNTGMKLLRQAVNQAGIRPIRLPIFDSSLSSPRNANVTSSSDSYANVGPTMLKTENK